MFVIAVAAHPSTSCRVDPALIDPDGNEEWWENGKHIC